MIRCVVDHSFHRRSAASVICDRIACLLIAQRPGRLLHQLLVPLLIERCFTRSARVLSQWCLPVLTMRSGSGRDIYVLVLSVAPHTQCGDLTRFQCRHRR
jgi:hypothetical protein